MTALLTPTPAGVVVALKAGAAGRAQKVLSTIGGVTDLRHADLYLVRPATRPASAREAWADVLRKCPEAEWACPVLKDADGNEMYPTGSIAVRFRDRPAAEALRKFAAASALKVEERNEFVPRQVSFRPLRPRDAYLPGLVSEIADRPEVEAAWASTLGAYRRS